MRMKTCCLCGAVLTSGACLSCDHKECDNCPLYIAGPTYEQLNDRVQAQDERVRVLEDALRELVDETIRVFGPSSYATILNKARAALGK